MQLAYQTRSVTANSNVSKCKIRRLFVVSFTSATVAIDGSNGTFVMASGHVNVGQRIIAFFVSMQQIYSGWSLSMSELVRYA